jgi:hypothetical protein
MRVSAAVLALILLAGCSAPPAAPVVPSGPETVLAVQPATVPAFSNANPPRGTIGATLWGPVETLPAPPSGVTSAGGVVDIVIDSASIPGNVAARSGLGTIVLGYSLPALRQATWYKQSYQLRVPRADHSPLGVAQVVAYFNLHDRTSRTNLWLGQIAYDTRCIAAGGAKWDPGTDTPLYNVRAQGIACAPFGEWRQMTFAVGPAQIVAAVTAIQQRFPASRLSDNPADYSLTHANINPETATRPGESARIDVGIRDWKLSTQP